MINQAYIDDFSENDFFYKVLNSTGHLEKLSEEYSKKYGNEANAYFLAVKESLDHYVAQKLSQSQDYVHTKEFRNYFNYMKKVINQNVKSIDGKKVYLELNVNVVFEYLDDNTLQKLVGNNYVRANIEANQRIINSILEKIEKKQAIGNDEIRLASMYFEGKKDFANPEHTKKYSKFVEYVMTNKDGLKSSPELVSAVLTFLPKYYGQGVENVRSFLAKYDTPYTSKDKKAIAWAHSHGKFKYTVFSADRFSNLDLKSEKSLESSRTFKEADLMFMLFAQFHELTHQVQKNNVVDSKFNINAVPYEIKNLLNSVYDDYMNKFYGKNDPRNFEGNHDSDEVEIDADQQAWKKLESFISKYIKRADKDVESYKATEGIRRMCDKNYKAVECRRAFSVKENPIDRVKRRSMDYDMIFARKAVQENPGILNKYPHLSHIITPEGKINTDFLFEDIITETPAGRMICNYVLNNVSSSFLINKINEKKYSDKQIHNLLENFVHVPHYNERYLRNLSSIDLKTYSETYSKYNPAERNMDDVYTYYFKESAKQFHMYTQLLDGLQSRLSKEYITSSLGFFAGYYKDMLSYIKQPNLKEFETLMEEYYNSKYSILHTAADKTLGYVKNKNGITIDSNYIDNQRKKAKRNSPDLYNAGIQDVTNLMHSLRSNMISVGGHDEGVR